MADITSIPQPGTVGHYYPYTPTHYVPGGMMQLTAPNWAAVGETAMKAGQALASIPLNYARTRGEMASTQAGIAQLEWLKAHPFARAMATQVGPGGQAQTVPLTNIGGTAGTAIAMEAKNEADQAARRAAAAKQPPPPAPSTPPAPAKTETTPTTAATTASTSTNPDNNASVSDSLGTSNVNPPQNYPRLSLAQPPQPQNPATAPLTLQGYQGGGLVTEPPPAPTESYPQNQPGSYIPSQFQRQPQQEQQVQPSQPQRSYVAQPQQPQPQPPSNIPSQFQDNTPEMQQWQETTNLHPVGDAKSALAWAQKFDTHFSRATYQSKAGPGGTPAWTFTNKDGASSTVPLPQMVKNGYAAQVAGQNLSMGLSASNQGQPGAGAQPPPAAPPPGQANNPSTQLPSDDFSRAIASVANVPSQTGQPLSAYSAQTGQGPVPTATPTLVPNSSADTNGRNPDGSPARPNPNRPNSPIDLSTGVAGIMHGDDGDLQLEPGVDGFQKFTGHPSAEVMQIYQNAMKQGMQTFPKSDDNQDPIIGEFPWTNPNDGKTYSSKLYVSDKGNGYPYIGFYAGPWQQYRLYGANSDHLVKVDVPDSQLRQNAMNYLGLDQSTIQNIWDSPGGRAKLEAVMLDKWDKENRVDMDGETTNRLRIIQDALPMVQRITDATGPGGYLKPNEYNEQAVNRQYVANRNEPAVLGAYARGVLGNKGLGDWVEKNFSGKLGAADPRLADLQSNQQSFENFIAGGNVAGNVSQREHDRLKGAVGSLDMVGRNSSYADDAMRTRYMLMNDFHRLVQGAAGARQRIPQWAKDMDYQIRANGRINDPGAFWHPGDPMPPNPFQAAPAAPAAGGSNTGQPAGSALNPIHVRSDDDYNKVGQGQWYIDASNRPKQKQRP